MTGGALRAGPEGLTPPSGELILQQLLRSDTTVTGLTGNTGRQVDQTRLDQTGPDRTKPSSAKEPASEPFNTI